MNKKFKRQRERLKGKKNKINLSIPIIPDAPKTICKKQSGKLITKTIRIQSSEEDRIIYTYERNDDYNVLDVTNVSQQTWINGDWVTVRRFDSEDGFLHVHNKLSIHDSDGFKTIVGVKQKGDPHIWLTWAIDDIKKRFVDSKRTFLKRSNQFTKWEIDKEK